MSKLLHVFYDTDFRVKHRGLAERAKAERKFNIKNLGPGDMLVFLNKKRDKVMVLAGIDEKDSYGVLGYYKSPHGRIDEDAIQYIPLAFSGGPMNYNAALKESLSNRLAR